MIMHGQKKLTMKVTFYHNRIGGSVTELQRLEFCVSRMRNNVICYFVFNNQSHYSGVHGQRVNIFYFVVLCQDFFLVL